MATALISGLTGRKVRGNVAMTGEITLKGKALPIGGLREKTMAAYKAGIKTVIIPEENLSEVKELEAVIREELEFIPVKEMTEVINAALCP